MISPGLNLLMTSSKGTLVSKKIPFDTEKLDPSMSYYKDQNTVWVNFGVMGKCGSYQLACSLLDINDNIIENKSYSGVF